ncbi:chloramphenicol-sensitive protein RarD [Haloactinopolyspora alba]|uniref:Chloramphenicol-sensitive protein RarD n=1 Tax=Haloactinopolyspora alba TaxID=648780 RepID=A0A2P8DPQ9_9ACTN|nr:EamA family transporter RarD [Haloactinopolyspora alba]PSK99209.1 chloramphenicol-sensitive protein RarD [Haloactinopolyspora alba]
MSSSRSGIAFAVGAYGLWGLFPLYLKQLSDIGDIEVLAHRIVWSLVFVGLILAVTRGVAAFRRIGPRGYGLLALAAAVITVNWGTYIWAVSNDKVVDASLGYYINPLVTVLLGVLVLGERMRRDQWVAMAIATAGVTILTVGYGHPPWVALTLACSFGTYGLIKKKVGAGAVASLGIETSVLFPVALAYLVVLDTGGAASFARTGWTDTLLLAGCGIVTAVPLMLFGAAAVRVPLTVLGPLQYIAPTTLFLLGVLLYDEPVSTTRAVGFVLIWTALAILTIGAIRRARRQARPPEATVRTGAPAD